MRRYDREKPVPGWEQRNRRGPGADHPEYRAAELEELRNQGALLLEKKRSLIALIQQGQEEGKDTADLEERLAEIEQQREIIERKIKKFYSE